jgi:hypothetical protein
MPDTVGFCRSCQTILRGPRVPPAGVPPTGPLAGQANFPPPGAAPPPPPPYEGGAGGRGQGYAYGGAPPRHAGATGSYRFPGGGDGGAISRSATDTMWASSAQQRGVFTRPTGCDILVGAFTAAALVSLFLPWYRYRLSGVLGPTVNIQQTSALGDGAGGWRWVALAVSVSILLYLGVRVASGGEAPAFPVRPTVVLAALAIVNLALLVIAFFTLPAGGFSVSVDGEVLGMAQSWGAFVGMIAAVFAATAGLVNRPGHAVVR